jgi:glycosyltransferase involved in cell wall biosynthesis
MNADEPLVSVLCITYNHEAFIAEALASIVTQRTDFPFEVIVRDDASSDRTADIIREYHQQYPTLIRPILETTNGYLKIHPVRAALADCRGVFIAYLEGDDFWLSDDKLQQAVNAFRSTPELALVGHRTIALNPESLPSGPDDRLLLGRPGFTPRHTLVACHTSSMTIRAEPMHRFAAAFPDHDMGDVALKSIAADAGPSYVFPEVYSAYRVHLGGLWSGSSTDQQIELAMWGRLALMSCGGSIGVNSEIGFAEWARGGVARHLRSGHIWRASVLWLRSIRHLRRWRSIRFMVSPVAPDHWRTKIQ